MPRSKRPADKRAPARRMPLEAYRAELFARFGPDAKLWRVVCPSCGHEQSVADFIAAAPDMDKDAIGRLVGFSCIGRLTGALGAFNREKYKPCNYTSGGLFCINTLFVVYEDGHESPAFEPAPAPAQSAPTGAPPDA